jgi:hypothetical protein
MSPAAARFRSTLRVVVGSFVAGAAAMVMAGLVAPMAVKGGLSVRDAMAAAVDHAGPAIQPLNVAEIRAELAAAGRSMDAARASSEASIERLDRLAGR